MPVPRKGKARVVAWLLVAPVMAFVLAACGASGGSSQQARKLLRDTFSGTHRVTSGQLEVKLAITPSGSQTVKQPIAVSFGGPFQGLGQGHPAQSDFTITLNALGKTGTLGVLSTGSTGYVSLDGTSYQLPSATFQQLEASFSQLTSSAGTSSGSGLLGKLGISPLSWLRDPVVVGNATVGGASTSHIHAGVDMNKLLSDLNTVLGRASSLGIAGASKLPSSISSATRARLARDIRSPTLDVWTGAGDHTLRKLEIGLEFPVSGAFSTLLGGLRQARVSFLMQYNDINQPQTISAPSSTAPYSQFASKLKGLLGGLQGTVGGTSSLGGASSASTQKLQRYTQCIQSAGNDVAKMQHCAGILNGK